MMQNRFALVAMLGALAFGVVVLTAPKQAMAIEGSDIPLRIHSQLGVQGYTGGVVSVGQLVARYRFADYWYVDAVGKSGSVFGRSGFDDEFYLALAVGPGLSTGEAPEGWEFRLSPRVTHVHHATTTSWKETPLSNLVGDSNGGVEHRTGLEFSVGVTGPRFGSFRERRFIWSADLLANFLPSSEALKLGAGAVFGLSLSRN